MKRFLIAVIVLLSVAMFAQDPAAPTASAATAPNTPAAATQANAASVSDGKATVYVYRYKQFVGSALEPSVYLDDQQLARMDNGRYFVLKVDPGSHVVRANDKQAGVVLDMKPGQDYYIRIEIVAGFMKGHGRVVHVTTEQGAYEIKKLDVLGLDKVMNKNLVSVPKA